MVISSLLARQSKTKADLAWLDWPTRPGLAWSDSVSVLPVSVLPGAGAGPGRAAKKKLLRTTEAVRRAVAWGRWLETAAHLQAAPPLRQNSSPVCCLLGACCAGADCSERDGPSAWASDRSRSMLLAIVAELSLSLSLAISLCLALAASLSLESFFELLLEVVSCCIASNHTIFSASKLL